MALPWASGSGAPSMGLAGNASVNVRILPFKSPSFFASLFREPSALAKDAEGFFVAKPGSAFVIEVTLNESPTSAAQRVVRASIDGHEIQEQLVVVPHSPVTFIGWLEDVTGSKRIKARQ